MSNDHRLLRRYIKESLMQEKIDTAALGKIAKGFGGAFGLGNDAKSGPQKWFADFMGRKLDAAGKALSQYFGEKLTNLLPDEMRQAVLASSPSKGDSQEIGDSLAKIVNGWMEHAEEVSGKDIPKDKKKEIVDYATEVYVKAIKQNPKNEQLALVKVTKALDAKYGSQKSEKGEKKKSD